MIEQEERRALGLLLDFEYLVAEFYERANTGQGLSPDQRGEHAGPVQGGRQVAFLNPVIAAFVSEASRDALSHIIALRRFLSDVGERPYRSSAIDLDDSFTAMARGAAVISEDQFFDAFANDTNLFLGAFMVEDVGITACAYALRAVDIKWARDFLIGLYGSLASRAAIVRAFLFAAELPGETNAIALFRQKVCGLFATAYQGSDHGVGTAAFPSMMPVDGRGLAWGRTLEQSAAILVGTHEDTTGAFFPLGINAMLACEPDRISLIPMHFSELSSGAVEAGVRLVASFDSEDVAMPALDLDVERFQLRENESHQPWTQSAYSSWAPRCIEISNAIVHGAVGIVGVGRHVIAETLWHTETHRHRYDFVGGAATLDLGQVETLDGKTVSILVGAAENYWHAMIDTVARLVLVPDELWPKIDRVLYPSTGVRNAEMLDLFGLPETVEKREVWPYETFRVADLAQPSSLHGLFDYHPTLLNAAFARLKSNVDLRERTPRRVFIDRRASPLRKLANEDELIAALPDFTPVRLEALTVEEQIRLFANADFIVAPHGAGLTNIGFSRPGSVVVELMMDSYCNWCYRRLAAVRNVHYRCVLGRCSDPNGAGAIHYTTWNVDKDDLLRELDLAQDLVLRSRSEQMAE